MRYKKIIKNISKALLLIVILLVVLFGGLLFNATISDFRPEERTDLFSSEQPDILSDSTEYNLAIWNIGYCGLNAEMDFFYDGGKNTRPTREQVSKNLENIKEYLSKLNQAVDFIMLQEVDLASKRSYYSNQLDSFAKLFPEYLAFSGINYEVFFVPIPFTKPYGKVSSGIVTYCKFLPQDAFRVQFPSKDKWPTDLFSLDRCFLVSRFKLNSGKDFLIINTHNSAYDDGTMRKAEMDYFKTYLLNEYEKGNYVVVGGDWNQCPPDFVADFDTQPMDNQVRLDIAKDYLPDTWKWLYQNKIPTNRRVVFPYEKGKTLTTMIDYFLLSPNVESIEIKAIDLNFQHSDHNPVLAKIKLRK